MIRFDRKKFFDYVRKSGVAGVEGMKQKTVDSLEWILDTFEEHYVKADVREIAYCCATARHEAWSPTNKEIDYAIKEIGGADRPYGQPDPETGQRYYGRGLPQLTHKENYDKAGDEMGVDLVNDPDMVLEAKYSAGALVHGLILGWYRKGSRGRRLGYYFNKTVDDPVGARGTVNGDVAKNGPVVEGHYKKFLAALKAAELKELAPEPSPPLPPPRPVPTREEVEAAVAAVLPQFLDKIIEEIAAAMKEKFNV